MNSEVWVLQDYKVGNTNQAIALAEEMGLSYETKQIKYNILNKLPNFLLKFYPVHINRLVLKTLITCNAPKIIISAGRRTASLSLYLKKLFGDTPKVVQIMHPRINLEKFDFIVLPQHDRLEQISPKVLRVVGAINNVRSKMKEGSKELSINYPTLQEFIAVMVGGITRNYKFADEDSLIFADILRKISINHSLPLFITFSRRTPVNIKNIVRSKFPYPHTIYDPMESNLPNPYFGMLARGEFMILTSDSISMCSEATSSGKPTYIFRPKNFKSKKHKFFLQQLVDLGVAQELKENTEFLREYSYEPLNEVKKVIEIIKSEIGK